MFVTGRQKRDTSDHYERLVGPTFVWTKVLVLLLHKH